MSEGARSYVGIGYELAEGIPGPITNYHGFESESFEPKLTTKPNPNINPRGMNLRGRIVKLDVKGSIKSAPDSETQARLRAHHQGKVVTTTLDAPNTVYQHALSPLLPGDASPATYRKSVCAVVYRDDLVPVLCTGGKVSKVTVGTKENDYVAMTHDIAFANRSRMADPVNVTVAAAYTGVVKSRGARRDPATGAATDVYVKVFTGGALDGTAQVKVKFGLAAAYGATTYSVVDGQWFQIRDEANLDLGPAPENPMEIVFLKALTGDLLTAGATPDEWRIPLRRTIATPTYSTRRVFGDSQAVATFNGIKYVLNGWTLTGMKGKDPDFSSGSIAAGQVIEKGIWRWELSFDRAYRDRDFVDGLEAGGSAAVVVTLTGDRIGASTFRDSHTFQMAMEYADAGSNVTNADELKEKIMMRAYDDGTNAICRETIVNTIPAL